MRFNVKNKIFDQKKILKMQHVKIPKIIIVGAGPGGLTLYHALIKNKDKKEFDVKIFERDSGPKGTKYHFMIRNELVFFS